MPEIAEEIKVEAKKMGWSPKEEFRGDPAKWVDADVFVDRGKNMIPLLKENLERMSTKYGNIENELRETKKTIGEFVEYSKKSEERAYERAKKQYEKQIESLKAQMKAAVKAGDPEKYEQLENTMDSLEAPEKPEIKVESRKSIDGTEQSQIVTPEMTAWKNENTWFLTDQRMTQYAISVEKIIAGENPGKSQAEILTLITNEVKSRFPEKFQNVNRDKANAVDSGGGESRKKGSKHTFDDLPKEAKEQYAKFKKEFKERANKDYTKEDYLKDYDWSEEEE